MEVSAFAEESLELLIERLPEDKGSVPTLLSSRLRLNFYVRKLVGMTGFEPATP